MKKTFKCPNCKRKVFEYPAISRKDNKTEICSMCGTIEALDAFFAGKKKRKVTFL